MIHSVADARRIASEWYEGMGYLYEFVSTGTLTKPGVYAWHINLEDVRKSPFVDPEEVEELKELVDWIDEEWRNKTEEILEDFSFIPED